MLYLLVARNRPGLEALAKRQQLRVKQVEAVRMMANHGTMQFGGAILTEDGTPAGSMAVLNFASRAELDAWLRDHPYRTNSVWGEIEIWGLEPAPVFLERMEAAGS
jgi:uncharacterized protein